MKAAILVEQKAPLVVAAIQPPALGVGQVLVKVEFSGICGKQVEEIEGRRGPDPFLPHLLGHEGAGTVLDVGPGVRKVAKGDRVVLHWMKGSGIDASPPRFRWDGRVVSAGCVTTFSDCTVASENRITRISETTPFDVAALLGCAVTTGLGIVFNNAKLKPGQSVVIFGSGGIGVNVIQGAVLVNAEPIVAVDLHADKLQHARRFGATHVLDGRDGDTARALMELTGGRGFDVAVDTTGQRSVRELAYNVTSHTGRTILAGVPFHEEAITIDSFPLHFGRTISGVHGGDTNPDVDIPRYVRLYERGKLRLNEQITHRYPLDAVNEAVEQVRLGRAGRCLIVP
jgi:S-(hydroxymethyl)glutathione dehydrogenase/alcohol dehydrogenase